MKKTKNKTMDKDFQQTNHTKLYSRSSKKMVALSFVAAVQVSGCVSGRGQGFRDSAHDIDIRSLPEGSPEFNYLQAKAGEIVSVHFAKPNAKLAKKHAQLAKLDAQNVLRKAIEKGDLASVQLLLNNKDIDPNAVGNGLTSLVLALKCGREKLFYLLLGDQRINITDRERESGLTPLHLAIQRRFDRGAILLVGKLPSADLCVQDNEGRTPLHLAIQYVRRDIIMLLVNKLPVTDLYKRDNKGRTPLCLAIKCDDINTVELLVSKKLSSQELAEGLRLALQYDDTKLVFRYRYQKIVDLLLTKAKIDQDDLLIKDNQGRTPLHLAIECGDINAVELLVSKHPLLFEKDNKGKTPLELATRNKDEKAFKLVFDQIVADLGKDEAVASLFNEGGCSVFAYAYLSKHRYVASLFNNSRIQMPTFLVKGYKMFKHIIETVSDSLTFDRLMTISEEIDDIEYGGGLSRIYARSLRCLLKPYIENQALKSEIKVSRLGFHEAKEKQRQKQKEKKPGYIKNLNSSVDAGYGSGADSLSDMEE